MIKTRFLSRFRKPAPQHPSKLAILAGDVITLGGETDSPNVTRAGIDLLVAVMVMEGRL